jgi:DNA repair photolyase
MIKYIQVKTILNTVKGSDDWFGLKYNLNLYRGCTHRCIYCDSRSECYQIENFDHDIIVKENALELLQKELPKKRVRGTVGFGSMNDPYQHIEKKLNMTVRALEIMREWDMPVHLITKSNLVLRDIRILKEIGKIYSAVSFTITTADDLLSKKIEPFAPVSSERFKAIGILSSAGITTGITLMPVLPFITDTEDNIISIVEKAKEYGAKYIIPAFGMTLRDRQRAYYYDRLDEKFPGLSDKYRAKYKNYYSAGAPGYKKLSKVFYEKCAELGILTKIPKYNAGIGIQETLF